VIELLEEITRRIPPPVGDPQATLQALIIDSWFDNFVGVVSLVRIVQGSLKLHNKIKVMSSGRTYDVDRLGIFTPKMLDKDELITGEVGYVIAGIKDIDGAPVGDTLTDAHKPCINHYQDLSRFSPAYSLGYFPFVQMIMKVSVKH